jgi:hypothetical protein
MRKLEGKIDLKGLERVYERDYDTPRGGGIFERSCPNNLSLG